jgi:hypothetical protein
MNEHELRSLEKEVKNATRIATERAGELHDLVEDRLPAAYEELPGISHACYDACIAWARAEARLREAQAQAA